MNYKLLLLLLMSMICIRVSCKVESQVAVAVRLPRLTEEIALNAAALSSDGAKIITGSDSGVVKVWDKSSGRLIETREFGSPVIAVYFSADGSRVHVRLRDDSAHEWDLGETANY